LRLDADEKGIVLNYTNGGNQTMSAVNEQGLYALVLSSRKREAKEFKRWVTHEVIPTIRKTGSYSLAGTNQQSALQANDVKAIAKLVAKELKTQQEKQVKALLPKGNCIYVSTTDYEALQYIRETVHWMERLERREFFSVVRDFVKALVL
jgi:prophage antirepressor-like protein